MTSFLRISANCETWPRGDGPLHTTAVETAMDVFPPRPCPKPNLAVLRKRKPGSAMQALSPTKTCRGARGRPGLRGYCCIVPGGDARNNSPTPPDVVLRHGGKCRLGNRLYTCTSYEPIYSRSILPMRGAAKCRALASCVSTIMPMWRSVRMGVLLRS